MESLLSYAWICILIQSPFSSSLDFASIIMNQNIIYTHTQCLKLNYSACRRAINERIVIKWIWIKKNQKQIFIPYARSDRIGTYIFVWHLFYFQYRVWWWWLFFAHAHFYALITPDSFTLIFTKIKMYRSLCRHLNSSIKCFGIFETFILSLNPILKFAMPQLKSKQIFVHFDFRTLRN